MHPSLLGPFPCVALQSPTPSFSSPDCSLQMPRGPVGAGQGSAGNKTDVVNPWVPSAAPHRPVQQPLHTAKRIPLWSVVPERNPKRQ